MDVHFQGKFRNGLLWKAVQICGSQAALATYLGTHPTKISQWLNFRESPDFRNPLTRYKDAYEQLDTKFLELLGVGLEEIFPIELRTNAKAIADSAKIEAFLDVPVEQLALGGFAPKQTKSPLQLVGQHEISEQIEQALAMLTPKEAEVIRLRFGLGGQQPLILEEVAQEFHVTRERIRQIEAGALRKLRHPKLTSNLESLREMNTWNDDWT